MTSSFNTKCDLHTSAQLAQNIPSIIHMAEETELDAVLHPFPSPDPGPKGLAPVRPCYNGVLSTGHAYNKNLQEI